MVRLDGDELKSYRQIGGEFGVSPIEVIRVHRELLQQLEDMRIIPESMRRMSEDIMSDE